MEVIQKYFPSLPHKKQEQFEQLKALYLDWNAKINVISRKDMDSFYLHHVLHSLAIAKKVSFDDGILVLDVGTGGGFPGIPLAIMFPDTEFLLVDSIEKKLKVVNDVAQNIGLQNIQTKHSRMENLGIRADVVVSRAVASALTLVNQTQKSCVPHTQYYFLKGGDLNEEKTALKKYYPHRKWTEHSIAKWYDEAFFETKKLVYFR